VRTSIWRATDQLDILSKSDDTARVRVKLPSDFIVEPAFLFGYNGTFDTSLSRYGANQLASSGGVLLMRGFVAVAQIQTQIH